MVEEDSSQTGSNFVANNSSDNKDLYKDSMTYDKTKYAMHVFVTNNADGTCKVSSVYFRKLEDITNNTGTTDTTDTTGITYTVGEKLYKELDGKVNANNLFTNSYVKEAGKKPDANNSKSSLGITKTVTGDYGDKKKAFDFTIKLYEPEGSTLTNFLKANDNPFSSLTKVDKSTGEIKEITAYVQDISKYNNVPSATINNDSGDVTGLNNCVAKVTLTKKGNEWIATKVESLSTDGTIQKVTLKDEETEVPFQLKNGQYLTFVSLPAGFTYDVTETAEKNYTASATIFENVDLRYTKTNSEDITYVYVKNDKGDYVIGTNGDYRPYDADSDGDAQRFERVELNPIQQRLYALTNSITITGSSSPVWFADWDTGTDTVINGKFSNLSGDGKGTGLTTVGTSSTKLLIGEHDNSFDVINAFDDKNGITPTGLIVKNLPFIVMIALGVLAFLGLTKKRRAND